MQPLLYGITDKLHRYTSISKNCCIPRLQIKANKCTINRNLSSIVRTDNDGQTRRIWQTIPSAVLLSDLLAFLLVQVFQLHFSGQRNKHYVNCTYLIFESTVVKLITQILDGIIPFN